MPAPSAATVRTQRGTLRLRLQIMKTGSQDRHPLTYYNRVRCQDYNSPHTGKEYPSHKKRCAFCLNDFRVYHIPGTIWTKIDCCCPVCLWLKRFGSPYIESKADLFDLADVERRRDHQPSITLRRTDLLEWLTRQYRQYLYKG
jgi:hypothetical protein